MNNQVQRECPVCSVVYNADATRLKHGRQTTCSRICSYQLRAAALQNSTEHSCAVCRKVFLRSPSHVKSKHGAAFCSADCAYKLRKRVVTEPYVITADYDRRAAMLRAWETRRKAAKPYPNAARHKARANLIKNLEQLGGVSKFEREAAQVLRRLGFNVATSAHVRNSNGTFGCVFDLLIPERRLIVECHGNYWHGGRWSWDTPNAAQRKNLGYEERKLVATREMGLELRILWEGEFKKDPTGALLAVVR